MWVWSASCPGRFFFAGENHPPCSMDGSLGGLQNGSRQCVGNRTLAVQRVAIPTHIAVVCLKDDCWTRGGQSARFSMGCCSRRDVAWDCGCSVTFGNTKQCLRLCNPLSCCVCRETCWADINPHNATRLQSSCLLPGYYLPQLRDLQPPPWKWVHSRRRSSYGSGRFPTSGPQRHRRLRLRRPRQQFLVRITSAGVVSGGWQICFSRQDVEQCYHGNQSQIASAKINSKPSFLVLVTYA
jgi:hypothetical protein